MPKTQISDLIQDYSDLVNFFRLFIREIKAILFAYLSTKPDYKTFSLSLKDLNQFFDKPKSNIPYISDLILTSNVLPSCYISDSSLPESKNCQQKNIFKIIQVFFLARNIRIEMLKKYCHFKNIDLAILLLSKRYHKFLDVFSKKKANVLPIHYLYNLVINLKDDYQSLLAIMYRMSRDEI